MYFMTLYYFITIFLCCALLNFSHRQFSLTRDTEDEDVAFWKTPKVSDLPHSQYVFITHCFTTIFM